MAAFIAEWREASVAMFGSIGKPLELDAWRDRTQVRQIFAVGFGMFSLRVLARENSCRVRCQNYESLPRIVRQ
jgi:hypothetical protein